MSKSQRLIELMMTVNRMRKFTVGELADQFSVSKRTILRDLQELSELGVPLYSEVGPHGGYQVIKESMLPPIAFKEAEAVSIFFAIHALRHYAYLPFEEEAEAALQKFYLHLSGDIRDEIDQMKNRIDFFSPQRQYPFPHLPLLLHTSIKQQVICIQYDGLERTTKRHIQPIGVYAQNGLWYCPAYCFERESIRVFRCDRILDVEIDTSGIESKELQHVHLENFYSYMQRDAKQVEYMVELTKEGVRRCETDIRWKQDLYKYDHGSGYLKGSLPESQLSFFASFFMSLGSEAKVCEPAQLVNAMKDMIKTLMQQYDLE
ncbi:helix-turn-helix transcriptional regulator [Longirhabdus pacifica]|uniref:helix-turn-helix transcriptional regulator n=1 Tax=Longirhabdus pacifica TaxID=2305227 RepID=UPI001008F601|nr:YafY family protein [Longirhabdus pacifica]